MAVQGVEVTRTIEGAYGDILTEPAQRFLAALHRQFEPTRAALLAAREARQAWFDAGNRLDFAPETSSIRMGDWMIAGTPSDLQDRRVEITGPVDRKMIINALNSGAKCFMACFEDASTPAWEVMMDGQVNLRDAVRGTITLEDKGKTYALHEETAVLIVRPRGWHLPEAHFRVDGEAIAGALFDFGLYLFHNAQALLAKGSAPYFYLPKLEHYLEARLWENVFTFAESVLGLKLGTIKATVLIETLPAAFMAEEILFELREHVVALNCGRWDYIFSYIKVHGSDPTRVLPDRAAVTMAVPFMSAYAAHIVRTCHRRGAHAIGGMSAFIPVKNDDAANRKAFDAVRRDKEREARLGHDGTWVAHPALVPVAKEVFDREMPAASQLHRMPPGEATAADLTTPSDGPKTHAGLRMNVNVGIGYIASWLRGQGAAPLHNLMEDAATAEISRTQLWQWRATRTVLDSGELVDAALIDAAVDEELKVWRGEVGDNFFESGCFREAADILRTLVQAERLEPFFTLPAYARYFAR
jgi:malate synthase